jgi:hypothetical protein
MKKVVMQKVDAELNQVHRSAVCLQQAQVAGSLL